MPQQASNAAVLMDLSTQEEEMEIMEMFETLRGDITAAEQRTNQRLQEIRAEVKDVRAHVDKRVKELRTEIRSEFKEIRTEIKDVRTEIKEVRTETVAHVDKRFDDLRQDIQNATIIKHSRLGLAIAALVGIAVVGTFVLHLLEAIF